MMKYILIFLILSGGVVLAQEEKEESQGTEEEEYYPYEGQVIRNISFRIIDVSGPNVQDENGDDTSWFSGIANSLHYTTRQWVIRNYLIFREGDLLDPYNVSESERILRESDFFLDARINVITSGMRDSVDILVITKDRWTLIFQLSLNAQKNSYAGIRDDNLLGLGHELDGTITHDADPMIGWGYNLKYTAHNVIGSFVDAAVGIENNRKSSIKNLDFSRSFVSLSTRWAGGLGLQWAGNQLLQKNNETSFLIPYETNSVDAWAGYSFPVIFGPSAFRRRTNITSAVRVNRSHFTRRPDVTSGTNRFFANSIVYLFSTGIINRRYYRDHYINRFGPTEDVPIGGLFSYTGGYNINEVSKRYYSSVDGIYSRRLNNIGYLSLHTSAGGFFDHGRWEQNTYLFDLLYHSKLIRLNGWQTRLFFQNKYLIGTNRFEQEQIYLDDESGLRGYDKFSLYGVSRGLVKFETRIFTPFEPLGFAIGAKIFSDFGIIADRGEELFNSRVYQSYGAGLRISNESISRAQFDIALVYRPFTPLRPDGSLAVMFTSNLVIGYRPINFSKPTIIPYGEN
jgi:hypothetical protein